MAMEHSDMRVIIPIAASFSPQSGFAVEKINIQNNKIDSDPFGDFGTGKSAR
jgi:hypothetical protein